MPRLSLSVWALLALLLGASLGCLAPVFGADQKPLVTNPTTGKTEALQAGNTLALPDASGDLVVMDPGVQSASRIFSFPTITTTSTLATINNTQTFTARQIIEPGSLRVSAGGANGGWELGQYPFSSTYAYLQNSLLGVGAGNYAVAQSSLGDTLLNGSSGHNLYFSINNNAAATFTSASNFVVGSTSDGGHRLEVVGGNIAITTVGKGLLIKEGSNAKMGVAVLSAGTVVVSTTAVTATSRIFLTGQSLGTVAVPSGYGVSARVAGTSFTILASAPTDTSTVAWMIVEPAP